MGHIDWTEALSVGIDAIDAQHRRLLDIINRLDDAVASGAAGGTGSGLSAILAELEDYTKEHFSIEEEAFDETAYPEAKGHKAEHATFIGKLAEFRRILEGPGGGSSDGRMVGDAGAAAAMLAFLRSWLTRHISFSDKRYKPWLAGRF